MQLGCTLVVSSPPPAPPASPPPSFSSSSLFLRRRLRAVSIGADATPSLTSRFSSYSSCSYSFSSSSCHCR
eukprot:2289472-Pyramimonas_sp.AAC.1